MKTDTEHKCWWTPVLIVAGVIALAFGPKALLFLAIAATAVWYGIIEPTARRDRN